MNKKKKNSITVTYYYRKEERAKGIAARPEISYINL